MRRCTTTAPCSSAVIGSRNALVAIDALLSLTVTPSLAKAHALNAFPTAFGLSCVAALHGAPQNRHVVDEHLLYANTDAESDAALERQWPLLGGIVSTDAVVVELTTPSWSTPAPRTARRASIASEQSNAAFLAARHAAASVRAATNWLSLHHSAIRDIHTVSSTPGDNNAYIAVLPPGCWRSASLSQPANWTPDAAATVYANSTTRSGCGVHMYSTQRLNSRSEQCSAAVVTHAAACGRNRQPWNPDVALRAAPATCTCRNAQLSGGSDSTLLHRRATSAGLTGRRALCVLCAQCRPLVQHTTMHLATSRGDRGTTNARHYGDCSCASATEMPPFRLLPRTTSPLRRGLFGYIESRRCN